MLVRCHILPHTLLDVPEHKRHLQMSPRAWQTVVTRCQDNHVTHSNTKAFAADVNFQNMEVAGESRAGHTGAARVLKIPPPPA